MFKILFFFLSFLLIFFLLFGYRNVCEAVAYYRGFKVRQSAVTKHLGSWLSDIKKGNKTVSENHERVILKPLDLMLTGLKAWKRSIELNPSRFPSGSFTTIDINELEDFWNSRNVLSSSNMV